MILIYKLFEYKEWIYRGPVFSIVWADLSPIYYYIIAFPYRLLNYYPLAPAIFTSSMNLMALALIAYVAHKVFGYKSAIITAILYGFSFMVLKEGAFGLNPALIPPFAVLYFYSLLYLKKGKFKDWALFAISIAMIISFHPSGYFILPISVLMLILLRPKTSKRVLLKSSGILVVFGIIPYLIQEKKVAGWNINKWVEYVFGGEAGESVETMVYVRNYFTVVVGNIGETLVPGHTRWGIVITFLVLASIVSLLLKAYKKRKWMPEVILAFIIFVYLFIFGLGVKFENTGMHDSWFQTILIPWIILYIGFLLGRVKHRWMILGGLVIFLLVNFNRMIFYTPRKDTYSAQKLMIETIKKDAKGEVFDIFGTDPQPMYYILWYFEENAEKKSEYLTWIKWPKEFAERRVYYIQEKESLPKEINENDELADIYGRKVYRFE